MWVVASAVDLSIDRITKELDPVISDVEIDLPGRFVIKPGESAGVEQIYTAIVDGQCWFTARFSGHVRPDTIGWDLSDDIGLYRKGELYEQVLIRPCIGSQAGSQNMVANSIDRILRDPAGLVDRR